MDLTKLKVPAAIVLTLLGSAAGAGGTYAAAKAQLDSTAKVAEEAKAEAQKAQDDVHTHAVDIAVIKTKVEAMQSTLERIERAVTR